MKALNNYIVEKFKISKDINTSIKGRHNFERDEPLLRIHLSSTNGENCSVCVGFIDSDDWLIYFCNYTDDKGIRFSWFDNGDFIKEDRFNWEDDSSYNINKYNLLEYYKQSEKLTKQSIYLDKETALLFLEDIKLDYKNINKNILVKYFEEDINYKKFSCSCYEQWDEMIPKMYNTLKNEKL